MIKHLKNTSLLETYLKDLYKISEKIRCEKIGTSYFKGVKNNIEKFYQERLSGLDLKKQ